MNWLDDKSWMDRALILLGIVFVILLVVSTTR